MGNNVTKNILKALESKMKFGLELEVIANVSEDYMQSKLNKELKKGTVLPDGLDPKTMVPLSINFARNAIKLINSYMYIDVRALLETNYIYVIKEKKVSKVSTDNIDMGDNPYVLGKDNKKYYLDSYGKEWALEKETLLEPDEFNMFGFNSH